jgi:hypothetical protein
MVGVWLTGLIGVAVDGLATFCVPEMPVVCRGAVCFSSVGDAVLFAAYIGGCEACLLSTGLIGEVGSLNDALAGAAPTTDLITSNHF